MDYRSLENISLEVILDAHNDAFSDYQVEMQLTLEQFSKINEQRGVSLQDSIGAFDGEKLIGFILNAVRMWNGKKTAYDCGTGVRKPYRNQKIGKFLFQTLVPALKKKGIAQYLLEVIQSNTAAYQLYANQGFCVSREFICMENREIQKLKKICKQHRKPEGIEILLHQLPDEKLDQFVEKLDVYWEKPPSWQNSIDSIKATPERYIFIGAYKSQDNDLIGYLIVNPKNGNIPQFGVKPLYRRLGVGCELFSYLLQMGDYKKLIILNVDSDANATVDFLNYLGFNTFIKQYEMINALEN